MNWKFTHIEHPARIAMGLTVLEYCVLDILYQSQTHPAYSKDGWTDAGCHRIAKFLDLSSGTVKQMLDRLASFDMIEYADETKAIKRTTEKWYNVAYLKEEGVQEMNVQKVNRVQGVQKMNTKCSENEQGGVQKMNTKCSENEPIYKETNKVSNSNKRGVLSQTLFEVEKKEIENKWFPKKDIKLIDSYIKVFEAFKVIANRSRVQKETESNISAVLVWLRKKFTPEEIIAVIKDRVTKVDSKYHELPTLLRKEHFENTLNRIKELEEKQAPAQMTIATSWRNSQNPEYVAFCEWYTKEPSFTPPTENEYIEFIETGYGVFEDRSIRNLKRICLEAADYLKGKTTSFKQLLIDFKTRNYATRRAY